MNGISNWWKHSSCRYGKRSQVPEFEVVICNRYSNVGVLPDKGHMMISFNPIAVFMDSRRVTRGTPEMLVTRQKARLNELVKFARRNSRFYAEKYRGLPEVITDVCQLPPVTKLELMEHFDDVVTDPSIHKTQV